MLYLNQSTHGDVIVMILVNQVIITSYKSILKGVIMELKALSSDGKIAYLIKPILKVLQDAGGQLERSHIAKG